MAKKSTSPGFRDIITSINKGIFSPVYLLMGEEDYYIDKIVEALEDKTVPKEERDFNVATYYGADTETLQVVSRAQQFPLMCERQLVMLKEAQALYNAKSQLEKMAPYASHALDTTILVITYKSESLGITHPLVKAISSNGGIVFKSERLRDYQLAGPLNDYLSEKGVRINDRCKELLCQYIGGPLSKLFGEADKLVVAAGEKGEITPELIEAVIGISKDYNSFELIKSVAAKNYYQSLRILNYFAANPKQNPGVVVVATLFNYFSKLFIASIMKDKSDISLMNELDLKSSYSLNDYRTGLGNYKAGTIDAILHEIRNTDVMSKGVDSNRNEFDLLKELLFKIFTLR